MVLDLVRNDNLAVSAATTISLLSSPQEMVSFSLKMTTDF